MAAEEDTLAELRLQIDEIDSRIHDLLMQRTEVAQRIGAVKGADSVYMRPGREATVLRRLVARHRGELPRALIVRIWREVFAAVTALQGAFAVAVYAPEGTFGFRNLARDHYGWRTPITAYRSAAQVLEAVAEGRATAGVLPVPRDDDPDPWWPRLARAGAGVPCVVARLPFAVVDAPRVDLPEALAITLSRAEETGLDRAYLVVESREVISRSHLRGLLAKAGLDAADVQAAEEAGHRWLHLIEVEGFLAKDDPRIGRLLALDEGALVQAWAIGGYAVPLSLEEMIAPARKEAAQ